MSFTNYETKEINCKIVYFGPKGAGKSTNLRSIYSETSPEVKGGMFQLEPDGADPVFEFLPVSLGYVQDYHLKLHLYSFPSVNLYETLHSTLLKGLDGYVFVCDSQIESMGENIQSFLELKKILMEMGYNIGEVPRVIQYNKRDLDNSIPLSILREEFNQSNLPDCQAVATRAEGTIDTLKLISKQVLQKLIS